MLSVGQSRALVESRRRKGLGQRRMLLPACCGCGGELHYEIALDMILIRKSAQCDSKGLSRGNALPLSAAKLSLPRGMILPLLIS